MTTMTMREQLYRQIDSLPDDIVEQIADFALFVMARRQIAPAYEDWGDNQWQNFALDQLFRDGDEDKVTYSLADAQEIYRHSDDFAQEVQASGGNQAVLNFLAERRSNGKRIPLADVKKRLGLNSNIA